MMALVRQRDIFYLFDSHARDSCGMLHPNGTAVVMKFTDIHELEQYLYSLSIELRRNIFQVVSERLNICKASKKKSKRENDHEYQNKILSIETEGAKQARLNKVSEYKTRKQSEETDIKKQVRLQKERESKKRKRSEEPDSKRQLRLDKDRHCKKQKRAKVMSQPQQEISQQDYLNAFDTTNNGSIEEQCWAKTNINKFHKSVQYIVSHCTVCFSLAYKQ